MALKSTKNQYGVVAVSIHWLTAALILILIGSGFGAANALDSAAKAAILRVHVPVAIGVLGLMIVRMLWWWLFDRKPEPVAGSPRWQEGTAHLVHLLLYVLVLGMIATGIGLIALSGAGPLIFAGHGAALPDFWNYPPRLLHGVGARLLLGFLVLHAGAALYHHFARHDDLLGRMWFRT